MRLYLQVKVRHGRVTGVSDPGQKIAFSYAVSFADPQRPLPEVRENDKMAGVETDHDEISRRVRAVGHKVGALRILHRVAGDDDRPVRG